MTKKRPWYRSLSTPSQIVLALFLALCAFFAFGLFRQFDDYMAHRAALELTLSRRAALEQTGDELRAVLDDPDKVKESMLRDSRKARPGEKVLQIPPVLLGDVEAEQTNEVADAPFWQQWLELFFRAD